MLIHKNTTLLLSMLIFGCHSQSSTTVESTPVQPGTPVSVTSIGTNPMTELVELNATSAFLQKTVVKSTANGYLRDCKIQLGQLVQKGQLLYSLQNKEASALGNLVETVDSTFHLNSLIQIRANQAGYISQLDQQAGDYVQDGEQLAVISEVNSFAFVLDLPFEMRRYLPHNRTVELILPDSSKLQATITSPMPTVDPVSQTQRYVLKISPQDRSKNLPENLIVRVLWVKSIKPKVISLPKAAILTNEMQSEWWVMQLINDSTAVRRTIQKGLESGEQVEILSPKFGLDDKILLSGNFGLPDTARVVVLFDPNSDNKQ
ncbi:MAG: HlyD family efflux transporter periplasmic adaptor subunit [Saprospiraceae bacterium]